MMNFSIICCATDDSTPVYVVNFLGQSLIRGKILLASVSMLSKLQEYPLGHAVSCYLSPAYDFEDTQSAIEAPVWS